MTSLRARTRCWLGAALLLGVVPAVCVGVAPSSASTTRHATGCPRAPYGVHYSAPGAGKTVALTFDDGPGRSTRRIMAVLAAHRVTATFFNLGVNEARDRATVRAEKAAGYPIGDHTWDHRSLPSLGRAGQANEMDRERAEQRSITGSNPCLFRPPYGSYNATTLHLAQRRSMRVWYWSVDTEDWKADGSGSSYWVHRITARADAGAGQRHPVILMHNQPAGNPATIAALPKIITYYRAHGYTFIDLLGHGGPPSIGAVSPDTGPIAGGTRVTVHGRGFEGALAVHFGTHAGTRLHVVSSTTLLVTAPWHAHSAVNIRVFTNHGASAARTADHFTYVAPPTVRRVGPNTGRTRGGTRVAVSGTNFRHVTAVRFGAATGTALRVASPTRLYVTAPRHAARTVQVRVHTGYGTSAVRRADRFSYVAPPSVTSISPATATTSGGTHVTVTGTHFVHVASVTFGGVAGKVLRVLSPARLVVAPDAHPAGTVHLRIRTAYGRSTAVAADRLTFSDPATP